MPVPQTSPPPAMSFPPPGASWRALPALQRVSGNVDLVAPPDLFTSSLSSWQDPSFLRPLRHTVDPVGPSGVVDGLVAPVATPSDGSLDMSVRPLVAATAGAPPPVQRLAVQQQEVFTDPATRTATTSDRDLSSATAGLSHPRWQVQVAPATADVPPLTTAVSVDAPRLDLPIVVPPRSPAVVQRAAAISQDPPVPPTPAPTPAPVPVPTPPPPASDAALPPQAAGAVASDAPEPVVSRTSDGPIADTPAAADPPDAPVVPDAPLLSEAPLVPEMPEAAGAPPAPREPVASEDPRAVVEPMSQPVGPAPSRLLGEEIAAATPPTAATPIVASAEPVGDAGHPSHGPSGIVPTLAGPAAAPVVSRVAGSEASRVTAPAPGLESSHLAEPPIASAPTLPGSAAVPVVSRSAESQTAPGASGETDPDTVAPAHTTASSARAFADTPLSQVQTAAVRQASQTPPRPPTATESAVVSRDVAAPLLGEPTPTASPAAPLPTTSPGTSPPSTSMPATSARSTPPVPDPSPRRLGLGVPLADPLAVQRAVPLATSPLTTGPLTTGPLTTTRSYDPADPSLPARTHETGVGPEAPLTVLRSAGEPLPLPTRPPTSAGPVGPPSPGATPPTAPVLPARPLLGTGTHPAPPGEVTASAGAAIVQRSPAPPAVSPVGRAALPVAQPGTVAPTLSTQTGSTAPPVSRSLAAGALPPPRPALDPATVAIAAGIAHRDSDGSVLFAPPPATPNQPTVQRADESEPPPPPEPASPPAAEVTPPPPVTAPSSTGAAAGPAGGAGATTNLEELARRLFDPLSARIKAELRLDRERAGLVTDLRR